MNTSLALQYYNLASAQSEVDLFLEKLLAAIKARAANGKFNYALTDDEFVSFSSPQTVKCISDDFLRIIGSRLETLGFTTYLKSNGYYIEIKWYNPKF